MDGSLLQQVEALRAAPLERVRQKYRELFAEEPRSKHLQSLVRRIAWRLQANAQGGHGEKASEQQYRGCPKGKNPVSEAQLKDPCKPLAPFALVRASRTRGRIFTRK